MRRSLAKIEDEQWEVKQTMISLIKQHDFCKEMKEKDADGMNCAIDTLFVERLNYLTDYYNKLNNYEEILKSNTID